MLFRSYLQADGALAGNCNFTKPSSKKILNDFKSIAMKLGRSEERRVGKECTYYVVE